MFCTIWLFSLETFSTDGLHFISDFYDKKKEISLVIITAFCSTLQIQAAIIGARFTDPKVNQKVNY